MRKIVHFIISGLMLISPLTYANSSDIIKSPNDGREIFQFIEVKPETEIKNIRTEPVNLASALAIVSFKYNNHHALDEEILSPKNITFENYIEKILNYQTFSREGYHILNLNNIDNVSIKSIPSLQEEMFNIDNEIRSISLKNKLQSLNPVNKLNEVHEDKLFNEKDFTKNDINKLNNELASGFTDAMTILVNKNRKSSIISEIEDRKKDGKPFSLYYSFSSKLKEDNSYDIAIQTFSYLNHNKYKVDTYKFNLKYDGSKLQVFRTPPYKDENGRYIGQYFLFNFK